MSVTVPTNAGHRGPPYLSVHRSSLPPHHLALDPEGFLVTTVARTAIDLARGLALPQVLVLLDSAARHLVESFVALPRRQDYANPRLARSARDALEEAATISRACGVREALSLADPRRETPIESLSAGQLHLAGLPMPEFQPPIRTPMGTLYPDFLWRDARLIGEADGALKYTEQRVMLDEKAREQALRDLGFRIVRWLGREIYATPHLVMDRIARALGR